MTQHTPGPWEINTRATPFQCHVVSQPDAHGIREIFYSGNNDANARLIAAAPALLAALENILRNYVTLKRSIHTDEFGDGTVEAKHRIETEDRVKFARAAIAKAKAET